MARVAIITARALPNCRRIDAGPGGATLTSRGRAATTLRRAPRRARATTRARKMPPPSLPDDVLAKIFDEAADLRTLGAAVAVSRGWRDGVAHVSPSLPMKLVLERFPILRAVVEQVEAPPSPGELFREQKSLQRQAFVRPDAVERMASLEVGDYTFSLELTDENPAAPSISIGTWHVQTSFPSFDVKFAIEPGLIQRAFEGRDFRARIMLSRRGTTRRKWIYNAQEFVCITPGASLEFPNNYPHMNSTDWCRGTSRYDRDDLERTNVPMLSVLWTLEDPNASGAPPWPDWPNDVEKGSTAYLHFDWWPCPEGEVSFRMTDTDVRLFLEDQLPPR